MRILLADIATNHPYRACGADRRGERVELTSLLQHLLCESDESIEERVHLFTRRRRHRVTWHVGVLSCLPPGLITLPYGGMGGRGADRLGVTGYDASAHG